MLQRWSIGGMCCGCDVLGRLLCSSTRAMLVVVMDDQGGGMSIFDSIVSVSQGSYTSCSADVGRAGVLVGAEAFSVLSVI